MTNPEFRRTILIGLGGAGQQVVLRTKRFFLDTYGVLPPSIKILCLDTDDEALKMRSASGSRDYTIEPQEFLHLQVSQPSDFISATPTVSKWYVKPVPVGAINRGAGAVRQNGRLALFYHISEIHRRIDTLITALNDLQLETHMHTARERLGATTAFELSRRDLEIYVCGSLAGGTGSGTFLDMGLLLRDKCPNSLIHGFFLIPWVYRNKAFAYRVSQNAYAALAEIDNLQSIMYGDKHFIPYRMRYGNVEVEANKAPYDLFHVIDGRNEYSENIDDVGALCEAVANALFLSIGAMSYRIASVTDNLLAYINVASPRIWEGRYARYSSLGVSSIHYPAPELHRLLTARNALALCTTALQQLQSGRSAAEATTTRQRIAQEVDSFIKQLNLYRNHVRAHLCPEQAPVSLTLENFEIADPAFPALLLAKFEGEQKSLEQSLALHFQGAGQVFGENLLQSLEQRLQALANDPHSDSATRREWGACLVDHLQRLLDDVSQDRIQIDKQLNDFQHNAEELLVIAEKSRYLPLLGGHRKSAALRWAEEAGKQLTARKAQLNLEQEKQCYATLLRRAETAVAIAVPSPSEIAKALLDTENELRKQVTREEKNLDILRSRPNHVLLGYGSTVVVPNQPKSQLGEAITLPYESFVQEAKVYTAEDYLRCQQQGPGKLTALFLDYCRDKLADLTQVTVDQALETLAQERGDRDSFVKQQFDHLFRLSAALWSFDRGHITPERAAAMDKIINLGFYDHEADVPRYERIAEDTKARFHIRSDLAYSTTGDPYHIWLLNYAAAIPAYFLNGLREARNAYYEQISPTYHVDSYFEMNVPDLFPVHEIDNKALRVLGMAIVPGIDVIHDEKLTKGHKFTGDHAAIRDLNYGDPKVWRLFRDMYAEVKDDYVPHRTDNLFDVLVELLKERVGAMERDDLRRVIEAYIAKVCQKLENRDFSRLFSARLSYQEIRALQDFLKKPPHGYGLDIDKYIAGVLG